MRRKQEVTPPGFEDVVRALKNQPGVDNPWAVANAMRAKGIEPKSEAGKPYDPQAMYRRYQHEVKRSEANAISALGAIQRKGARREASSDENVPRRTLRESQHRMAWFTPLKEVVGKEQQDGEVAGTPEVIIISAGRGNKLDRNYYPPDALSKSAGVFEGAKCFLDHPSRSEESERPERTVRDIAGWFSDCRYDPEHQALVGKLNSSSNSAGIEAKKLVEDAVKYQRQYPNKDNVLVGLSINAEGPSHQEEIDGEPWNVVESIKSAMSADLVTFPARGGKVLGMREAEQMLASARWRTTFKTTLKRAA